MTKQILGCAVGMVVAIAASQALAVVPMPSAYWDFNNSDGQSLGTYDGFVQPSTLTPDPNLKLIVQQFNGLGGTNGSTFFQAGTGSAFNGAGSYNQGGSYPMNYRAPGTITVPFVPGNDNYRGAFSGDGLSGVPATIAASTPSRENYVASGATFPSPGTAYNMVGGKHFNYNPMSDGNPVLNPQLDSLANGGPVGQSGPQTGSLNDKFSYQDRLRLDPGTGGGNGQNPAVDSANGQIAYSFWLKVNQATSLDDATRTNGNASIFLGRSNGAGNNGGIYIRDKDGVANGANSDYVLNLSTQAGQTGSSSALVFSHEWNHWTVQFDTSVGEANGGTAKIWKNGGLLAGGQEELFTSRGVGAITGLFRLNNEPGGSQHGSGDFVMDDLAVWKDVLLSNQDALDIFQKGVALAVVPEPSSLSLILAGAVALLAVRRRKARM